MNSRLNHISSKISQCYYLLMIILLILRSNLVSPALTNNSFLIFKSNIENDIKNLSNNISVILKSMCTEQEAKCKIKSFNQCEGSSETFCIEEYPKLDVCHSNGVIISNRSGTRLPNNINASMLTNYGRLSICATTKSEDLMRQTKIKHTNKIHRIYFGLQSKFFRAFPGVQQNSTNNTCFKSYDPTSRLWYVGAVTGSKKIIIMIDISTSMNEEKLANIKSAAAALIDTLSFNDFVGVIFFSRQTRVQASSQILKRATFQIKTALKSIITSIGLSSSLDSNYELAFSKAKELFSNNMTDVYGAPCSLSTNIVLLLAASAPTVGKTQVADLIASVDEWGVSNRIKMFTYGFGNSTDSNLLKSLACKYEGSMFQVSDLSMTSTLIRKYESWLAESLRIDSPVWSEPYDDATTGTRMVTISMPIYSFLSDRRRICGAMSIDVSMQLLQQQYTISQSQFRASVMSCTPVQSASFTSCLIQNLRPSYSKCHNIQNNCPAISNPQPCSLSVTTDIYAKPIVTGKILVFQQCCGIYEQTFVIIVVVFSVIGGILALFGIGILIFCYFRAKREFQFDPERQEMNPKSNSQFTNSNQSKQPSRRSSRKNKSSHNSNNKSQKSQKKHSGQNLNQERKQAQQGNHTKDIFIKNEQNQSKKVQQIITNSVQLKQNNVKNDTNLIQSPNKLLPV